MEEHLKKVFIPFLFIIAPVFPVSAFLFCSSVPHYGVQEQLILSTCTPYMAELRQSKKSGVVS